MNPHAEIEALFARWAAAVASKDVDTLVGLVTEDAELWSHGAAPLTGRSAVRATFEAFFSRFDFRQDFELVELIVFADAAFARGVEHNHLHPLAGGDDVERPQRAFMLIRREPDGEWRFARGMTNLPPAA
jgi:uncharacterized protein (TIGR02246 family)